MCVQLEWQAQEELNDELSQSLNEMTDHINTQAETLQATIAQVGILFSVSAEMVPGGAERWV